jgi:two-component system response regulator AtoC
MAVNRVLVVDDEESMRHVLSVILRESGYQVSVASDGASALALIREQPFDAVISDVRMPQLDGLQLLQKTLALSPQTSFIVMSAYGAKDLSLQAMKEGAYGFIEKPFKPDEVVLVLRKAEERQRLSRENVRLREELSERFAPGMLLGDSASLAEVKRQVARIAQVKTTVLVTGETGTGKELVARAIHEASPRVSMAFIPLNCGAMPAELLESELFGHVKGAFTDAHRSKKGLFAEADGGTLFLDEVAELPLPLQVKLLRVLQDEEVRPVGDTRSEKVDVRVLAATNRDLQRAVAQGQFREDLYYRLNVVNLQLPPLRERQGDVLRLAKHFIERFNDRLNRQPPVRGLTPGAEEALNHYSWPGNVRELENVIERAIVLCDGELIDEDSLPEKLFARRGGSGSTPASAAALPTPQAGGDLSLKRAYHTVEDRFIRLALRRTKGNRTRAAELLEISHRALLYKLKEYAIDADAEGQKSEGES